MRASKSQLWLFCVFSLYVISNLCAQDADTVLLKDANHRFTLVSQIEDPAEASAFLAILKNSAPSARYQSATNFIRSYPQSWLLAQVFDIAARSAIDSGQYDDAVTNGRFSLRLLPENPSLLILLANLEAQQHVTKQAIQDATDAMEYLGQIERPPDQTESEWTKLRPQLEASAYFARARAEAAEAMHADPIDRPLARKAWTDLDVAAAWNPNDPEIFYLRAILEIKLSDKRPALSDLEFVLQSDSSLKDNARQVLSILKREISFDEKTVSPRAIDASLRHQTSADFTDVLRAGYAGPEACRSCHADQYSAWRKTGMSKMLAAYRADNVIGDFSASAHYEEPGPNGALEVIRFGNDKRPYFELKDRGLWNRYYVDFTIGSKWQQAYATRLPDGRLQVFPIEYNLAAKKWVNYWRLIDPPGSERAIISQFPRFTSATNYQKNCAVCHVSQLKLNEGSADPVEHASYLQPGIDCEMCHGPSAWHIQNIRKGNPTHPDALQPPFDFRAVSNRAGVRVCAQCHRQSAVREIGVNGEMNYSSSGNFVPAAWIRPYDAFSRKAFYKDGRFRESTFIVEAFTRSACYLRGTAQCATCHSPHLANFETNPTSLKYRNTPDEMCLNCHSNYRNRISEHSRHKAGTEASQCVSCHMPRIVNALLFQTRSHQIEIPTADMTVRFGQQESPNVCLTCHAEKNALWAGEQLSRWRK